MESAYPHIEYEMRERRDIFTQHGGMTLRDAFAIAALPAIVEKCTSTSLVDLKREIDERNFEKKFDIQRLAAVLSYDYADAMLEVRKE